MSQLLLLSPMEVKRLALSLSQLKKSNYPHCQVSQLDKFEVVLLKKAQVKEFEEMFHKKEFLTVTDPLYRAWLTLKFAASGTESEAIDRLLSSKIAKNVPKRKKLRGRKCSP